MPGLICYLGQGLPAGLRARGAARPGPLAVFALGAVAGVLLAAAAARLSQPPATLAPAAGPEATAPGTAPGARLETLRAALERSRADNLALEARVRAARAAAPPPKAFERATHAPPAPAPAAAPATPEGAPAAALHALRQALAAKDGRAALVHYAHLAARGETAWPELLGATRALLDVLDEDERGTVDPDAADRLLQSQRLLPFFRWTIGQPDAPASVRELALERLNWADDDQIVPTLFETLATEKEKAVAASMAQLLLDRAEPGAVASVLHAVTAHPLEPETRAALVDQLERTDTPEVRAGLAQIRSADPDPQVRSRANLILLERDPPGPGLLICQVGAKAHPAEDALQEGDIVVRMSGIALDSEEAFERAQKARSAAVGTITVVRWGRTIELPGRAYRDAEECRFVQPGR